MQADDVLRGMVQGLSSRLRDTMESSSDRSFTQELRAFVAAVMGRQPSPLSLEDAREATRLACALRNALVQPSA